MAGIASFLAMMGADVEDIMFAKYSKASLLLLGRKEEDDGTMLYEL
jgi:hypothetical protein